MTKITKLSLALIALISALQAENQFTLEQIEVTASQGTTLNKKDVTDSVTVITKEALEEARVSTLDEALNKLGGISIVQNGGAGQNSSMLLRGMSSKRLLVLIDGVRYNNPTTIGSAAEFSQIMLYNVEQIEIIKGAQSGVWGADASGGVINIITSKAKRGLHGVTNLEYGSYNTVKASLQASYATEQYDILIGGLSLTTDGFSAVEPVKGSADYGKRYDDLGLEKDGYINKSLNAKLGFNFTEDDRLEASIQSIDSSVDYDTSSWNGTASVPSDSAIPKTDLRNRFYNIAFKHKDSLNDLKVNYSLSTFDRDTIFNASSTGQAKYEGSVNEIKLDDKISYMKNSFLRLGVSYQKFEQKEITANTNKDFSATSVFATNYNKLNLFSDLNTIITESIRYDEYDNFNDSLTGKIGAKQFVYKDIYVSTNIGTGYNAPTLGQLYGQWGPNPDLKPEKSLTSDITLGSDILWATYFYNETTDLIEYDTAYTQVSGTTTFTGVELGYEDFFFNSLGLSGLYTYVETKNADGEALRSRPKNQVDAKATYYVTEDFDLGLNAQYIGTRYDEDNNKGAQTGEYIVANFVINIKANKYVTIYGKIDNITDKYYQVRDGYATAGRSLYIGLNAKY